LDGSFFYNNSTLTNKNFRISDIETATTINGNFLIIYSIEYENILTAELGIIKTCFICLILLLASLSFEKDTKRIVLDPLEYMLELVDMISKDPDKAKDINNEKNMLQEKPFLKSKFYSINKIGENKANNIDNQGNSNKNKEENFNEIEKIENAIKKIFGLLAVCLGEAGNEIIKKNLSENKNLDALVKGSKTKAIFGFCDIRDFSTINESLQEDTILLLNEVAEIVHSSVDLFFGAINKNLGDSFLSVWKNSNNNDKQIIMKNIDNEKKNMNIDINKNANANKKFSNENLDIDDKILKSPLKKISKKIVLDNQKNIMKIENSKYIYIYININNYYNLFLLKFFVNNIFYFIFFILYIIFLLFFLYSLFFVI